MIFGAGISSEKTLVGPVEAILISAATVGESEATMRRTRKMLELLGWPIVMCDSGGFQILTSEIKGLIPTFNMFEPMEFSADRANISPKHVLEIAAKLDPTYLVCLDYPIRKDIDPSEFEREFDTKLDYNVDFATATSLLLPEYGLDHERLLIPVQCYTLEQFEIFWSMLDGLQFGGLSMPIREMPNDEIVLFLRSMRHKDVQQVHILGSTKTELIAIGAFAARHYFEWLSLDATTWFWSAKTQQYQHPVTLKNLIMGPGAVFDDPVIPCGCPWCGCYTSLDDIKNLNYADKCAFLCQHNFWAINNFAKMAYAAAVDLQTYRSFLENCSLKNGTDALIGNLESLGT
jgi:hypothetical protein